MELKKLTDEQEALLRKPLPQEAISKHPSKTFLSTIKAIYVTERFNEVFGIGGWVTKVEHITTQESTKNPMVVVKLTFEVPEYGIYYESYGGNDNADLGDAYKGATTDAITKIGSFLEVGIDVFKGKGDKANTQDEKPWLSDNKFRAMVKAIEMGGSDEVKKAMSNYKIRKDYSEQLNNLLK